MFWIIFAFVFGLIHSVPIGALGQVLLNKGAQKGLAYGRKLMFVDAIVSFCYAFVFLYFINRFYFNIYLKLVIEGLGILYFIYLAIKEIEGNGDFVIDERRLTFSDQNENLGRDILMIVTYYITNPLYFIVWLNFSIFINQLILPNLDWYYPLMFSAVFAVGAFCILLLSLYGFRKVHGIMSDKSYFHKLLIIIYLVFIIYIVYDFLIFFLHLF